MFRSRVRRVWARHLAVVAGLILVALVPGSAAAIPGGGTTVKVGPWVTSADPDLAGLKVRLWMTKIPNVVCDYQLIADFDWTNRPPRRFIDGTAQYPDSFGITFSVTENKFVRRANSHSQVLTWTTGATKAPEDVDAGATGVVWSFRELGGIPQYMSSGQIRFVITRGSPCSNFTMTAQARYQSNDGLAGGPINVSVAWFVGVGYDIGGVSDNGRIDAEWTYAR